MTQPSEVLTPVTGGSQADRDRDAAHSGEDDIAVFHPSLVTADVGFFSWDIATGEVFCDPETYRMHGLPQAPSASMDAFLARVPPSDIEHVRAAMRRMLSATGTYQIEYRVKGADGGLRSMEARGRILPGPDGRPARMLGLVTDTTVVRARSEAEQQRLRVLADRAGRIRDFTASLAASMTVEAIVEAAEAGLAAYGASGLILLAPHDCHLDVVASCGFAPEAVAILRQAGPDDRTPISAAIRSAVPVYLSSPRDLADRYPAVATVIAATGESAWVAIPVPDSTGTMGACLFSFTEPQPFDPDQRALLSAAAGLLAQSLERVRSREELHALATELQRGMLPRGRLDAPRLTIATRYRAATSGMEIGGDFYDVVPLSGGRSALVIGDVEGHNLLAASLMGQLRTAVHAYAREGHDPAEVLSRANQWLMERNADPDRALFATCCFIVVDPVAGELAVSQAGHPPPVLAAPGARPRVLACETGLPLGVDASADYVTTRASMAPRSILMLATDGLLDAAGDSDDELATLLEALRANTHGDLERLADALVSVPGARAEHGDDVALLLARLEPAVPGRAGRSAAAWLSAWRRRPLELIRGAWEAGRGGGGAG